MVDRTQHGPLLAKDFHVLERMAVATAFVFMLWGASFSRGDTAYSRLATVQSLTKYGTWAIDRPIDEEPIRFEQGTIDKVMIDGHLYSSKPPMLPLLMTGEYVVMNRLFGWSLDDEADTQKIVRWMTVTLIGLAYVLTLVFFSKTLDLFVPDPFARLLSIFSLAFCTQLWGYSNNINNHVPAACLIMIAVYYALGLGSGKLKPRAWRFVVFGLAAGLVPTIDLPGTVFVAFAGLYLFVKHPLRAFFLSGLGAAIPLGIHFAIMIETTGSPLPVQVRKELYRYEASYWRNPRGIDALNEPKWLYLFNITFGKCGVFALYPILFAGVASAVRALVKCRTPYRGYILGGAAAFGVMTAYYVLRTNNYAGEAYGFRWYIVAMPMLMLMGAPLLSSLRVRWKWYFIAFMVGISFYSAWECSSRPWGANREWTSRFLGRTYGPTGIERP